MIKLYKNNLPLKEFFSVYNSIEYLQSLLSSLNEPTIVFSGLLNISFELNNENYEMNFLTEKQTQQVVKWIDSFVYERPANL